LRESPSFTLIKGVSSNFKTCIMVILNSSEDNQNRGKFTEVYLTQNDLLLSLRKTGENEKTVVITWVAYTSMDAGTTT
jgi:hypothetical protein